MSTSKLTRFFAGILLAASVAVAVPNGAQARHWHGAYRLHGGWGYHYWGGWGVAAPRLFPLGLSLLASILLPLLPVLRLRVTCLRLGARAQLAPPPSLLAAHLALLVKTTRT